MVTWKDIGCKVITPDGIGELIDIDAGAAYYVKIGDNIEQYTIEELRLENDKMPSQVRFILEWLTNAGYESYICGGAVRDYLLGKEPHDYDITTSATPNQVMEVFKHYHVLPTGLQHGTVTIMLSGSDVGYEVTTFRKDGDYSDGRHPDSVQFTSNIIEDLSRRDFTINAMAYNPEVGLIDPFGGQEDLKKKIIRCVGNPRDRFNEDALRILRAIRFASQLDFTIIPNTDWEIHQQYKNLENISIERINSEFCKIASSDSFCVQLLLYKDVFSLFIPELKDTIDFPQNNPWHIYNVFDHTIHAVEHCESEDLTVRLAVFFHDFGKPHSYQDGEDGIRHFKGHGKVSAEITDNIMKRLRFDNETRNNVVELVYYHDATFEVGKKYVKRWLNKIGEKQFRRLLELKKADNKAQNLEHSSDRIKELEEIELLIDKVIKESECFSLKDLAVNGKDLINVGYKAGKELGNTLNELLQLVIDGECPNKKEELLEVAGSIYIGRRM